MENLAIGKYDIPVRQLGVAVVAGVILGVGGLLAFPPAKPPAGGSTTPTDPNGTGPAKTTPDTKPDTKPDATKPLGATYEAARSAHPTHLTRQEAFDPTAKTPSATSQGMNQIEYESFDGLKLALWTPKVKVGAKPKPGVLLLSEGFEFRPKLATEAGSAINDPFYATLPLVRGQAGMPGHFSAMYLEAADVRKAAQRVGKLAATKDFPVFVVGQKEGGTLALLAALLDGGNDINGVVVVGGHTEPKDSLKSELADKVPFKDSDEVEWRMRAPLEFASSLKVPVLLIHDGNDQELLDEYERFKAAAPAGKVEIKKFAGTIALSASVIGKYLDELTKKIKAESAGS